MQESAGVSDVKGVAADVVCDRFSDEGWVTTSVHAPSEMDITIYINLRELVTILCTPTKLNCLILGFLYSEGIISGLGDVTSMRVCEDESMADVRLKNTDYQLPTLRTSPRAAAGRNLQDQGGEGRFRLRRDAGGGALAR